MPATRTPSAGPSSNGRHSTSRPTALDRFREYRTTRDRRTRNALIEEFDGLARRHARRFAQRGEVLDDLVQVARVGLLKAVERFDPDHGTPFASYARATIDGELKRHFRDATWDVKVPRQRRDLHSTVRTLAAALTQRLGRAPTIPELAEAAGAREDDVIEALDAGRAYRCRSIEGADEERPDWGAIQRALSAPGSSEQAIDDRLAFEVLLRGLSPSERRIVSLRFVDDLTQVEIARIVGVSQMQVSRVLARSFEKIRTGLAS